MCSIIGIAFQKGSKLKNGASFQDMMKTLLKEGQQRGGAATGVAYVSNQKISVLKKDISAREFVERQEFDTSMKEYFNIGTSENQNNQQPIVIHGHCRLPTKGSPKVNENNHPILCGNVVGAHNGWISNDDELFEGYKEIVRIAQVDSEVIFALINHFSNGGTSPGSITSAVIKTSTMLRGAFAFSATHSAQPHCLFLVRNASPCEIVHFYESGVIMWASCLSFIRTAIEKYNLGEYSNIELPQDSGIGIDLANNKINHFSLK